MRFRWITACLMAGAVALSGAGHMARGDEPAITVVPDSDPAITPPDAGAAPKAAPEPTLPPPPASTKTPALDDKDAAPRYRFSASGEGFVRLDAQTGEVAYCAPRTAGWACQPAADERAALEAEIARLADSNVALKRELAMREAGPPTPPETVPPHGPSTGYRVPEGSLRLPTNEDIDRAVSFAGKVWKRLVDMLNDIQKDAREKI